MMAIRQDRLAFHLSQGGAVSMAVRITGLALAFVSHLVLSRILGASQYGSYVIALGWAMVLVIPARLGLDNSVLRFATIYREEGRASDFRGLMIFSLGCIAGLSILIAGCLLTGKAAGIGPLRPIDGALLGAIALLVPFSALLGWLSAVVRTANRIFASQFYEQVLRPVLLIATLALLVLAGQRLSAPAAMWATALTVGAAMIGIAFHSRAAFAAMPSAHPSYEHRREWLAVSWTLFMMSAVQELLNQIDIILLGILGNATQAAHFAAAWRLASLVPFGLVAIAMVGAPLIASAYQRNDIPELARISRLTARIATLIAVAIGAVLFLFGRPLLGLFGPGFADAYPVLAILLLGGLVNSATGSVGYLLIMTGRQWAALGSLSVGLILSLVLNISLIPRFGPVGSAIASTSAVLLWNVAMIVYVRRRIGIDASAVGLPVKSVGD